MRLKAEMWSAVLSRQNEWYNSYTSLIFEVREDDEGEYYHLVTLWRSTREEERLYAEST